MNNNLNL